MNPHIIIQVSIPAKNAATDAAADNWTEFQKNLSNAILWRVLPNKETGETKHRLSENVWMIPLNTGLPIAGELIQAAKHFRIECRFLILPDSPAWVLA